MVIALVFLIACTRSGCTCCHLHKISQFVNEVMLNWKTKSWTVTRVIMWLLCEHGVEASKDWVLSQVLLIYSTPRCRAQTYTPKTRFHTSDTGGLVWAVRLWIFGISPTMHSKCHACILVCKMYNTSKAPALWKSSQVCVNSAPSRYVIVDARSHACKSHDFIPRYDIISSKFSP